MEGINNKTGMTHGVSRKFIEFVNRKNVKIGNVNVASNFVDHGTDVPAGMPPGPAGAIAYVRDALKRFPDFHVTIEDMIGRRSRGSAESLDGYGFAGSRRNWSFAGLSFGGSPRAGLRSDGRILSRRTKRGSDEKK